MLTARLSDAAAFRLSCGRPMPVVRDDGLAAGAASVPGIRGGQGRSGREIEAQADAWGLWVVGGLAGTVVLGLVVRGIA